MFESPVIYGLEKLTDKLLGGFIDNFIASLPIMLGASFAVYALLQMYSKRLANLGVVSVFVYGTLIIL